MDCPTRPTSENQAAPAVSAPAVSAYLDFARRAARARVPVSGDIEITRRCNFDCIHCYLGREKSRAARISGELQTQQWKDIIDEIVAAGCLFLLFTGGEPLLRKDFPDLYAHAKKRGLIVTVFTNGSLVDESIIDVFHEYPPNCVEVSLYGATEATYAAITRRPGMLEKSRNGLGLLVDAGIRTRMKTVLLTKNRHEFDAVRRLADDYGLKFRFDGMIFPCLDGDRGPTAFRISPEEVAEKNLAVSRLTNEWRALAERMKQVPFSDVLYDCGAGTNNFHIDPFGWLKPCLMINDIRYDLVKGSFRDGWENRIPNIREKKIPLEFECKTCENRAYCGYCPAFFRLDTGSETTVSEYLCRIGRCMADRLNVDEMVIGDGHVRKERSEKATL
jgi:radical SAM protein with 4Fe4S-binding SPASM domain